MGSCLGPVLFSIFISDLDKSIEEMLIRFADDNELEEVIFQKNQNDVNMLEKWVKANRISLNE